MLSGIGSAPRLVCMSTLNGIAELTVEDCLLLRLHAIVLCLPYLPCRLWLLCLDTARSLLAHIRHRQQPLVHHLHRVLEAPRGGPGRSMGRERCFAHRHEAKGL